MDEKKDKHIVLVGPAYPYRGGIAHFLEEMYHELIRRGHRVSVVTFSRQYPSFLFPGKTQFEAKETPRPFSSMRLIDSINPRSWGRAASYICRLNPDVVIFKYWLPFFAPAFGKIARRVRKQGIRVLSIVHNALPHEPRPGDVSLTRYFLKACDGLVVMSGIVESDLDRLGISLYRKRVGHPVYGIFGEPFPKEDARKKLGIPLDAPVLLFFGFIRRYKGLHVLLESLPSVIQQAPGVRLIVAGESYEDGNIYRDLIKKYGLTEYVHLHMDYIPNEEVKVYFAAADVVVQPYISATQSGVAQVAYHFDRPLIVTDVGGLAEFVPHNIAGLVVPPGDPDALATAIVRFFTDHLGDRLIAGVREEKKKYSWTYLCEAVEDLIQVVEQK